MNCHPEHDRDYYWNTTDISLNHRTLHIAISRDKFKKINRLFHVTGASTTLTTSTTLATSATSITIASSTHITTPEAAAQRITQARSNERLRK
jgi:hypothetical protein